MSGYYFMIGGTYRMDEVGGPQEAMRRYFSVFNNCAMPTKQETPVCCVH